MSCCCCFFFGDTITQGLVVLLCHLWLQCCLLCHLWLQCCLLCQGLLCLLCMHCVQLCYSPCLLYSHMLDKSNI